MSDLLGLLGVGGGATLPTLLPTPSINTSGTNPTNTGTTPRPPAPGLDTQSGSAVILGVLQRAGLADSPDLTDYANQLAQLGLTAGDLAARLDADINNPASIPGKVIAQKYPALVAHNTAALAKGLPQMNVGDYLATKQSNLDVIQASGLTPYVDANQLADKWITGFTSPAEAQARINAAVQDVFNEPPEVRAEMQREFGVGDALGAATAYYLDPANAVPKILEQQKAAEIGGAALRTGFGLLTPDETTRLAQQGVTADQAQQGFGTLASQSPLFAALPGSGETAIDQQTQLAATFSNDAAAKRRIAERQAQRLAQFGGGGQAAATTTGLAGLGSAATP